MQKAVDKRIIASLKMSEVVIQGFTHGQFKLAERLTFKPRKNKFSSSCHDISVFFLNGSDISRLGRNVNIFIIYRVT